jgi:hypothetical protein
MQLRRYRRAAIAAVLGLVLSSLSSAWSGSVVGLFLLPAYVLGGIVSGNPHAPSEVVAYAALWAEWTVVVYGLSVIFFPRQARIP